MKGKVASWKGLAIFLLLMLVALPCALWVRGIVSQDSFVPLEILGDWRIPVRVSPDGQAYILNTPFYLQGLMQEDDGRLMISSATLASWLGVQVSPRDEEVRTPSAEELVTRAKRIGDGQDMEGAPFLVAALYHPDPSVRTEALLAIRRIDDPIFDEIVFNRFVEYYTNLDLLRSKNGREEYRSTLGWTISAMGKRSLPRIQKALDEGYASDELRERFSWIIGHLISKGTLVVKEDPLAAKLLRRLLKDPSELVRVRAAGSLGRGGLTEGYPVALAGLSADDGFTRMTAAWALGFIGIEEGIKKAAVVAMEGTDDLDQRVQWEAVHALGNLAEKTMHVELKRKIVEHVMPLLSSSDTGMRLRAVVVLWKAEHKPAALRLAELLLRDPDVRIRRQAARGLAKLSVPATIPFLLEALDDPHREVRKWVVNAFRTLETDDATTAKLRERLAEEPDKRICEILRGILEKKKRGKTVSVGRQRL